jgi:hypothetical protein
MLAVEQRGETHFLSNEEKEKLIEDYVESETAGARKRVDNTEAVVPQEEHNMTHAEIVGLMSSEPENTFEEMLVAIGDSLSDLASSDHGEEGEVEDDEEPASAKTKSPSSNLFSLLYPQTQKNEIEVSLKYGIALLFQSVL